MQVAVRAPRRDMIGNKVLVEGIEYTVGDQGVIQAHDVHVAAFRSLGFNLCKDESPDIAEVTTITPDEAKAVAAMRKVKFMADAPPQFTDDPPLAKGSVPQGHSSPPGSSPPSRK
jgi:hypothetical protein